MLKDQGLKKVILVNSIHKQILPLQKHILI